MNRVKLLILMVAGMASCWHHESPCSQTETDLLSVRNAVERFHAVEGRYPADLSELRARGEIGPNEMKDAWKRPLIYTLRPSGYQLFSVGQDGIRGTADDQTPGGGWSSCRAGCALW